MSSTDNPPSLALSDIMHHMSPSPAPFEEQGSMGNITEAASIGGGPLGRDASPEIYNAVDVTPMRQRLEELGFLVARPRNGEQGLVDLTSNNNTSSREKELLDMVIRLTEALPVDPAQLERQAGTIANLTTQRDFIALQAEEERARWRSERESWERSAEALLSQRNRQGKSEDSDRLRATFESENRVLREKLQDAHRRLSSLESELMRLKPMLLMQPYSTSRPDKGKGREVDTRSQLGQIPEETETKDVQGKSQYYAHNYQAPPKITVNSPATASTSKAGSTTQPSQHQSRRSKDRGSKSKRQVHPLSSDAYTEHMLLAAKRIGRKRAATVAGIIQHAEREKAALAQEQEQLRLQKEQDKLEQDRQERVANGSFGAYYRTPADGSTSSPQRGAPRSGPSAPRTPKRTGIHYSNLSAGPSTSTNPIPINLDSPLVYVNVNPAASQTGSPWAGSGVMGTPGQIRSALNRETGRGSQKAGTSNPPTPLASLLDAALMMDDEGRGGIKPRGKTNGKGRALEEPESPMPKRRKISSAGKQAASGSNMGNSLNRVKSALDVLADQAAAAVVEPDQSDKRASESGISNAAKGKGKNANQPKAGTATCLRLGREKIFRRRFRFVACEG
ncbi:hypothetical protein GALMADRAFT_712251 [Galerina marginata CBS 339.88]|uniref:Uncharacterized protein n=1 Tax=Galerina marginata (strain CBS 339.88) TaxID=685588 RepID=A0A067TMI0_GALM3|nr:hypothetical protein GALMADRAFT_712251 [Galerina marginata CBS 339.88]